MKNATDFPWQGYKREIAVAIKDITLMHQCGPKARAFAHKRGVTQWVDLTPETIASHVASVMQFVDMNRPSDNGAEPPSIRTEGLNQISKKGYVRMRPKVEFYMDFESIGNTYDDFSQFPEARSVAMIFLIGLIVVDNVRGTSKYISYLIDKLDHRSERAMTEKMLLDIKTAREQYGQDFAPIYFWSNAENYMLERAMGKDVATRNALKMIDLCKAFRESGMILPGQMGYGLKGVAKTMHRYGMIETTWKESAEVASGLNATIEAMKTYNQRDPETRKKYFRELIDYNYVDCKVMEEILEYVRSKAPQMRLTPEPAETQSFGSEPEPEPSGGAAAYTEP
jgi:hypothetical protein